MRGKRGATLFIAGMLGLTLAGCANKNADTNGEAAKDEATTKSVAAKPNDTLPVVAEDVLVVDSIKYDLSNSQIVISLTNSSESETIGDFSADMLVSAMVNGNHEVVHMDMGTYAGYLGFNSKSAGGYVCYSAEKLQGLTLKPKASATVKLDYVGTMHDMKGVPYFDKENSCNIDGIRLSKMEFVTSNNMTLSYKYPESNGKAPDYSKTKPSGARSRWSVVATDDYSVTMSDYAYSKEGLTLKLKVKNKGKTTLNGMRLTYMVTNEYGMHQEFTKDVGNLKAGDETLVKVMAQGVNQGGVAPQFTAVKLGVLSFK